MRFLSFYKAGQSATKAGLIRRLVMSLLALGVGVPAYGLAGAALVREYLAGGARVMLDAGMMLVMLAAATLLIALPVGLKAFKGLKLRAYIE
jgi:hypothetical protein